MADISDDEELQEIRKDTDFGDRASNAGPPEWHGELVDAIAEELDKIDAGGEQKTVSVWDGATAAFIRALETDDGELTERGEAVGHALQKELGKEPGDVDRSDVLRMALRVGFQEAAPDEFDALRQGAKKHREEEPLDGL